MMLLQEGFLFTCIVNDGMFCISAHTAAAAKDQFATVKRLSHMLDCTEGHAVAILSLKEMAGINNESSFTVNQVRPLL